MTSQSNAKVDVSDCPSPHSLGNRIKRAVWGLVWAVAFRPTPKVMHGWRRWLLRCFGATIAPNAHVHPSVQIFLPDHLTMEAHSCLAPHVDCYCVAPVKLGPHATVSQYSYLCTASHDYEHPKMPLTTASITIGEGAWVCANVFVGPGVTIEEGAVVGACSCVTRDVPAWMVVAGNPAKVIKPRRMEQDSA